MEFAFCRRCRGVGAVGWLWWRRGCPVCEGGRYTLRRATGATPPKVDSVCGNCERLKLELAGVHQHAAGLAEAIKVKDRWVEAAESDRKKWFVTANQQAERARQAAMERDEAMRRVADWKAAASDLRTERDEARAKCSELVGTLSTIRAAPFWAAVAGGNPQEDVARLMREGVGGKPDGDAPPACGCLDCAKGHIGVGMPLVLEHSTHHFALRPARHGEKPVAVIGEWKPPPSP